jgi:hypothetical protein
MNNPNEEYWQIDRRWLIPILFIIMVILLATCLSCTARLQGSHSEPIGSNAGYRSLYYHPYKVHKSKWYNKHHIYWFDTPAAHPNDCTKPLKPFKHYNRRYVYG